MMPSFSSTPGPSTENQKGSKPEKTKNRGLPNGRLHWGIKRPESGSTAFDLCDSRRVIRRYCNLDTRRRRRPEGRGHAVCGPLYLDQRSQPATCPPGGWKLKDATDSERTEQVIVADRLFLFFFFATLYRPGTLFCLWTLLPFSACHNPLFSVAPHRDIPSSSSAYKTQGRPRGCSERSSSKPTACVRSDPPDPNATHM